LAIETTGRLGSIALLSGQRVLRHTNLDPEKRTAATLAPAIEATLDWCRSNDSPPQYLTVADGPGSFTGLRIGVTTAKILGYSLKLPIVGVDSVAAIAAAAFASSQAAHAVLVGVDAYRQQIFAGQFERSELLPPIDEIPQSWTPHPESVELVEDRDWQAMLEQRAGETDVAGDPKPLGRFVEAELHRTSDAIGVGLLGLRAAIRGEFIDPMKLVPRYLKLSAAEEKAAGG
jgi:tRNA threonylcarbamoyladenosine biosynthesis protein TsaB